jgi:ubiquinone biosynthesis protein
MQITEFPKLAKNAERFREVLSVLAKYGLAPWLNNVKIDWIQRHLRSADGQRLGDLSQAVKLRLALTELGTTFIKLGQVLSTRPDLVGPDIAKELSELQSGTPADAPETVVETIQQELGNHPDKIFSQFDSHALASASVGQVHKAVLQDGTEVVLKVQHKGIEKNIRNDLDILQEMAKLAERYSPELARYRPMATAAEFRKSLLAELDFVREQRNIARFAKNFSDDESIRFPTPYPEFCSRRVLTMGMLRGQSLSHREALIEQGFNLSDLARRGADMFLKMVFRDGFYHADPHPGNLMVLEGEVIGVLDCGMVGRVDDDLRDQIEDMLMGIMDHDVDRVTDSVVEMCEVPVDFDRAKIEMDISEFVDEFRDQTIDEFDLGGALEGVTTIIREHRMSLPAHVSLLVKMLVMLEGTAQQLSPDFSIGELLGPYKVDAVKRRLSPQRMLRKLHRAHRDWNRLVETLPGDVSDIMDRIRSGSFDVNLEHRKLDKVTNRLVLGVLSAALFVGSSFLWSNNVKPVFGGVSLPGVAGCVTAVYLGFILVRAIRKAGNI